MNILYKRLPSAADIRPCAATVGIFDGVHQGHARIIRKTVLFAQKKNIFPLVITFFPAPECVLEKAQRFLLADWQDKVSIIRGLGCPNVVVLRFDEKFAGYTGEEFFAAMIKKINIRYLFVGDDFQFGKNRYHGIPFLRTFFKQRGGAVWMIRKKQMAHQAISSSRIREYIRNGDVVSAGRLLGRDFRVKGVVTSAKKLGRLIGVPTANLSVDPLMMVPRTGIYAVKVSLKNKTYDAVANIGFNPTTSSENKKLCFETHIFDFSRDIVGQIMMVSFVQRLRDERKFDSLVELSSAIQKDIALSKKILRKKE